MTPALRNLLFSTCLAGSAALAGTLALAQDSKDTKLPPGWTQADMQACVAAGTPGRMHENLKKTVGVWNGTSQHSMAPGAEVSTCDTTWTISSVFDGRYIKTEVNENIPGMGPYSGTGFSGFDNVSQQYVGDWVDNHSTGIMQGTGEATPDGTTISWRYTHNCPINKKPTVMRLIQKITGEGTMTVDFFSVDPKSGKEFNCTHVELKRSSS